MSPTVRRRPMLRPVLAAGPEDGVEVDDPYVRQKWVAVLGPSAVADLMRLVTAARRRRELAEPLHLATLLRWDLVRWECGDLRVLAPIPRVPDRDRRRFGHHTRLRLSA